MHASQCLHPGSMSPNCPSAQDRVVYCTHPQVARSPNRVAPVGRSKAATKPNDSPYRVAGGAPPWYVHLRRPFSRSHGAFPSVQCSACPATPEHTCLNMSWLGIALSRRRATCAASPRSHMRAWARISRMPCDLWHVRTARRFILSLTC
jgi:hypothetical protein